MLAMLAKGILAGAVGTLAMDAVWFRRYRSDGGEDSFAEWEFSADTASFDDAGAPAQIGRIAADKVGVELPDETAGLTNNVVHWVTGIGYGLGHAVLQRDRGLVAGGLTTGVGAFLNSYGTLGSLGVYDPIWEYDRDTLADDLSAHVVFGLATSAAFRLLSGSSGPDGPAEPDAAGDATVA